MRHFGIIGYPVSHSQSAVYFNQKFAAEGLDAEYSLYPLSRMEDFPTLVVSKSFSGMNVTIPYKQAVMPYLDRLDETAEAVGAVNVIRFDGDQLVGYNTDAIGFMESIRPLLLPTDREALILGTGGAAKACCYALRKLGLHVSYVSRRAGDKAMRREAMGEEVDVISYEEALSPTTGMVRNGRSHHRATVIVNATPCGMTPDTEGVAPFPFERLQGDELLFDCIYTPEETRFLRIGRERGCRTCNGQGMLRGQAIAAWQIWNQK